jgi:hypothetical protein
MRSRCSRCPGARARSLTRLCALRRRHELLSTTRDPTDTSKPPSNQTRTASAVPPRMLLGSWRACTASRRCVILCSCRGKAPTPCLISLARPHTPEPSERQGSDTSPERVIGRVIGIARPPFHKERVGWLIRDPRSSLQTTRCCIAEKCVPIKLQRQHASATGDAHHANSCAGRSRAANALGKSS